MATLSVVKLFGIWDSRRHKAKPGPVQVITLTTLRSLAIGLLRIDGYANIAAANRHHARDPQRTLKLLQTA